MGATKYRITTKKDSVRINLYTKKVINDITMLYLKEKINSSELLLPKKENKKCQRKRNINKEMTKNKIGEIS